MFGLLLVLLVVTLGIGPLAQALLMQPGLLLYGVGGGVVAPSIVALSLAETAPQNAGAASGGLLTTTIFLYTFRYTVRFQKQTGRNHAAAGGTDR